MAIGSVEIKEKQGVCTVTFVSVEGAHMGQDQKFKEWLSVRQASAFPPGIIFDLSSIKFIDSLALGPLISACGHAARRGSKIAVVAVDPRVKYILGIMGFYKLKGVEVYGDLVHAEGSIGAALWG